MSRAPDFAEIRPERPEDRAAIRALLTSAFASTAEADLVDALRAAGDLSLALVAGDETGLAGFVGLSRATLGGRPALALAPLAVAERRQFEGVGSRLVRAAIRDLEPRWSGAIVVLGDPLWYARFGFFPAPAVACRWAGPHMMALSVGEAASPLVGEMVYAPAFDAL
ncbi:MAG: N-acetyltransferase [Rhizobiales bacterium]|nr:N-acetyltransferase [Hyphomicrobiales bacterium]